MATNRHGPREWGNKALQTNKAATQTFIDIEMLALETQTLLRERDLLGAITLLASVRNMAKDGEMMLRLALKGEYE